MTRACGGRVGRRRHAVGARTRGAHAGHDRCTAGRRGARGAHGLGARAGQGCALCALDLFSARFDSVLFLSRFLDIACEPSS